LNGPAIVFDSRRETRESGPWGVEKKIL